jgi:hypothetical protein
MSRSGNRDKVAQVVGVAACGCGGAHPAFRIVWFSFFSGSVISLVVSLFTQGHVESAVPKRSKNAETGANGLGYRP